MSGAGRRGGRTRGRGKGGSTPGGRGQTGRLRSAKGRTASSARWLERQLADPYVAEAKRRGYRSRAAFKLAQIDDKYRFFKRGARVLDLGAAPGGWSQIALERCGPRGRVVGVDSTAIDPLPGAAFVLGDFLEEETRAEVRAVLGGPADVVLSDMAAPATGHARTDHLRVMALAEAAFDFAEEVLAPGGAFVAKVLQGGTEAELLARLKRAFRSVRHVKPPASRSDSAELYLVATGFRGAAPADSETD
ncbi:MAG TPA: RlmE family RNA methyltransferase [Kiloniellales bacterium]|nr:RlmE family RNA methyltransferase [Kiloniellales bacterium]